MAYSSTKQITIVISAIDRTSGVWNRLTRNVSSFEDAAQRAFSVFSKAAAGIVGATTAIGLSFNAMRERAEITFSTLAKSSTTGKRFVKDLFDFVSATPLDFSQSIKSAQELYTRGFALQDVIPVLKILGDTAAAIPGNSGDTMDRIALALGQIQAKGKVSAEEMTRQLGQVIPAWKYVADAMDTTVGDAMERAKEGSLDVGETIDAILKGMQKDFGGTMEAVSGSVSGMVQIIKRQIQLIGGEFTGPLFERVRRAMKDIVAATRDPEFMNNVRSWGETFDAAIGSFGKGITTVTRPAIRALTSDTRLTIAAVVALVAAFAFFNPAGAIIIGLTAAVTLIGIMKTKNDQLPDSLLKVKIMALQVRDAFKQWVSPIVDAYNWVTNLVGKVAELGGQADKNKPGGGSAGGGLLNNIKNNAANIATGLLPGSLGLGANWLYNNTVGTIKSTQSGSNMSQDTALAMGDLANRQYMDSAAGLEELWMAGSNVTSLLADETVPAFDSMYDGLTNIGDGMDAAGDSAEEAADKFADDLAAALEDGVITMAEAIELDLTPAMAANYELTESLSDARARENEKMYDLEKAVIKFMLAAQSTGDAVTIVAADMAKSALELQRQAASDLYARPTKEEAMLQYRLADIDYQIALYKSASSGRDATRDSQIKDLEGQLDRMQRDHDAQIEAMDLQIRHATPGDSAGRDALSDKRGDMQDAFDKQEDSLKTQIDNLKDFGDPYLKQLEDERGLLQNKLTMMQAENALQQAGLLLMDQTLITERDQNQMQLQLLQSTQMLSGIVAETSRRMGDNLIPSFDSAERSAYNLSTALQNAAVSISTVFNPVNPAPTYVNPTPGTSAYSDSSAIDTTYRNVA